MKFEQNFRIGIRELGLKNQITNYGILAYLEDVATYHSDTCGYGVKDVFSKKKAWLLMDWELEVKKRPVFGECIRVNTNAVSVGKPSFHCYRNFELFDETNEVFATATSKWVLFDGDKNKITKVNEDILELFHPEGDPQEAESKLLKLQEPINYESIYEYEVKREDLDVNNHMNNLNYLKLAYEALPDDVFFGEELDNLRIMYKKQIKLGEKVKCFYSKQDDGIYVTIKSEDEKTLHAIVKLW